MDYLQSVSKVLRSKQFFKNSLIMKSICLIVVGQAHEAVLSEFSSICYICGLADNDCLLFLRDTILLVIGRHNISRIK